MLLTFIVDDLQPFQRLQRCGILFSLLSFSSHNLLFPTVTAKPMANKKTIFGKWNVADGIVAATMDGTSNMENAIAQVALVRHALLEDLCTKVNVSFLLARLYLIITSLASYRIKDHDVKQTLRKVKLLNDEDDTGGPKIIALKDAMLHRAYKTLVSTRNTCALHIVLYLSSGK
jgi:hypothetical protein